MGSSALKLRANWQKHGGANAAKAEHDFLEVFENAFKNTNYKIRSKPKEFTKIYTKVKLSPKVLNEIYNPPEGIDKHGISPDYAIDNVKTGKTLYVEVKRQDGWVENKPRKAGRGNAHERSCKYFTPGLLAILREKGKITNDALPFWTVFQGDITRDPCRVREITCWYAGYAAHFFFWRDSKNPNPILDHFAKKLSHLLD